MKSSTFSRSITLPVSAADAFAWHERPGALERLMPPWEKVELIEQSGGIRDGGRVLLRQHVGPIAVTLEAEHFGYRAGLEFNDRLIRGPFARWEHRHGFKDNPRTGHSVLTDEILYEMFGGPFTAGIVRSKLQRMFGYRHAVTVGDLELWRRWSDQPRLRILVSGASGLVGRTLCPMLTTQGHRVIRLTRKPPAAPDETDLEHLATAGAIDAVVHLAGENVGGGFWTAERRRRIMQSREEGTRNLVSALARLPAPPKVFVGASAIGYYGNQGDAICTETDQPGRGFLSEVCQTWERETMAIRESGCRSVAMRIGVVLSPAGGALRKLLPLFRAGLGGPLGNGKMWVSWISVDDLGGAIVHALMDDRLNGPVNAVAPEPVTNATFSKVLGSSLGRPAVLPVPTFALRTVFGEMADETFLSSTRVEPVRLQETAYEFRHPRLDLAFKHVLGAN